MIMLNNLQQMHLKLFQKEQFKKEHKQLVIWLFKKWLIKLWNPQELICIIVQRQLKTKDLIKRYINKDVYLLKKDKKLLIKIWDWYNSIIIEYQKIISLLGNTLNQPSKFRKFMVTLQKWAKYYFNKFWVF